MHSTTYTHMRNGWGSCSIQSISWLHENKYKQIQTTNENEENVIVYADAHSDMSPH